ncbi:PREDICTED: uncharacterized protein LOC109239245 [Nicotiana attenuata]|uniref:uncharacterized protein LOC109239245 n=1 Tax=Nicotiana attenuata TaxID=49451 RepID=UPI000904E6F1|nr:PREDICTED: uncharacterized protein LOC109239245 [Nicotiana attenuata]
MLKVLETLDAVVDVGGVYDPSRDRYDHHKKGFEDVFGFGFTTKHSSAGLIYKQFGKEIIAKEAQLDKEHPDVQRLYLAVYKNFIERGIRDLVPTIQNECDLIWKSHLFELEEELKIDPTIKYVLFQIQWFVMLQTGYEGVTDAQTLSQCVVHTEDTEVLRDYSVVHMEAQRFLASD